MYSLFLENLSYTNVLAPRLFFFFFYQSPNLKCVNICIMFKLYFLVLQVFKFTLVQGSATFNQSQLNPFLTPICFTVVFASQPEICKWEVILILIFGLYGTLKILECFNKRKPAVKQARFMLSILVALNDLQLILYGTRCYKICQNVLVRLGKLWSPTSEELLEHFGYSLKPREAIRAFWLYILLAILYYCVLFVNKWNNVWLICVFLYIFFFTWSTF